MMLPLLFLAVLPSEVVVIGDSQAEGLKASGALRGVAIHAHRGQTAAFFLRWLAAHPDAVQGKSVVLFQLGGNDISKGNTAQSLIADMDALESLTHALTPFAEVYFGLIPVRGQWFDMQAKKRPARTERQEQTLETVNQWLASGEHPRFRVFWVNDVVANPEQPRLQRDEFRRRGAPDVHLNKRGYLALSTALAEVISTTHKY